MSGRGFSVKNLYFSFSRFLNAVDSISLILFSWFTFACAGSKSIATILDSGCLLLSSFITPLPHYMVRQAGERLGTHTIFPAPLWMSSSISPVRNQPSPVWFPMETISDAIFARSSMCAGGSKCLLSANALVAGERSHSTAAMPRFPISALVFLNPRWDTLKFWL